MDYIRQSNQWVTTIFLAKSAVSDASNQRHRPWENYVSEPRGDDASYIAQHTLTLFLWRTTAQVKRSNDNRRSIEWPHDTDVVRLIRPSTRLVSDPPTRRQSGWNPVLARFCIEHPSFESGPGVRRKNLTEQHGTQ